MNWLRKNLIGDGVVSGLGSFLSIPIEPYFPRPSTTGRHVMEERERINAVLLARCKGHMGPVTYKKKKLATWLDYKPKVENPNLMHFAGEREVLDWFTMTGHNMRDYIIDLGPDRTVTIMPRT